MHASSLLDILSDMGYSMETNSSDQALIDSSDAKFIAWSKLANRYFYSLNEFESLKPEISKARLLINEYGLPCSKLAKNKFVAAYFNAILFTTPDAEEIEPWYQLALESYDDISNAEDKIILYNHLMLYNIWNGNMDHARMLYSDFLGIDAGDISNPLIQMMRFTMCAQIEWLNMNIENSIACVEEGLRFASRSGVSDWNAQLAGQAVYAHMSERNYVQAELWLQKVEHYKNPQRILDNAQYHYLRGWMEFHQDQSHAALLHAKRAVALTEQAAVPFTEATSRILLAQVQYQRHDYSMAGWHVAMALKIGRKMRSYHILFAGLLAASWVAKDVHLHKLGLSRLKKAFQLGAVHGYYNIPGWPHAIMVELCQLALNEGIETKYTCKLIALHHMQPTHISEISSAWPWPVELFCFGSLRVRVQGKDIHIGNRQHHVIGLLKLLIIHPRGLMHQKVCDALWPEVEGDHAMRSLHVTQLRLRKLLGHQGALVVEQGKTHLNHTIVMNEMSAFSDILQQAEVLTGDKGELLVGRLVQIYEGCLLEGDMDLPGVIGCREVLHVRFLNVVQSHIDVLIRNQEYVRCEMICLKVLDIDDLAESVCYALLQIYHLTDSPIKMRRLYENYRLALRKQHGIAPSKTMQKLFP